MQKVCVILGAGASNDVADENSPLKNKGLFRPPLVRDLFATNQHPEYSEIMRKYQGACLLAPHLASRVSSGEISIEQELKRYAEHTRPNLYQAFKHIPPYLRDLLMKASIDYIDYPSNYIKLAIELLEENPHEVLFITLNYDTLLEQALRLLNSDIYNFHDIYSYNTPSRSGNIVKLHGSINWLRLIPGSAGKTWEQAILTFNVLDKYDGSNIIIDLPSDLPSISIDKHRVYPLLSAPLAGKDSSNIVCPESHLEFAAEFLKECGKFLIIGSSGLDDDLLSLLNENVVHHSKQMLHIVDINEKAKNVQQMFCGKVKVFQSIHLELFTGGFSDYISRGNLRNFAETEIND